MKSVFFQRFMSRRLPTCTIGADGSHLKVSWGTDGVTSHVPAVWLRDNSPHAMDSVSLGRTLLMGDLNLDVRIDQEKFPE